jgi:tRNA pseudouridine55 synthase
LNPTSHGLPQLHGVLVLDKPKGPTSARCIGAIKRLGQKKIGHAGTLDPMATGVLVVLLGEATKIAAYVMDGEKTYLGTLRLGQATDTYDAEGTVTAEAPWEQITAEAVGAAIAAWREEKSQEVPPYSAAKHQGRPLYELARKGLDTPVKEKEISVFDAQVVAIDLPSATFRVRVTTGTYIRSLVHSLGKRLGCGAVLTALTREASSPFDIEGASSLDTVLAAPATLPDRIIPLAAALPDWPVVTLDVAAAALVGQGVRLPVSGPYPDGMRALLADTTGRPLALAQAMVTDGTLRWAITRGLYGDPQPARRGGQDASPRDNTL